jgi:hypothetical protein
MKTVKFDEILGIKEVKVPDTEIILTVKNLSWPDFMESLDIEKDVDRGIFRLKKVIIDWNLVDKDGKKIELTPENISKIPTNIMLPIVDTVKDYFGNQKKKITEKN